MPERVLTTEPFKPQNSRDFRDGCGRFILIFLPGCPCPASAGLSFLARGNQSPRPELFLARKTEALPRAIQSKTGMAQPRPLAGRAGLFLDPQSSSQPGFILLMSRINIWIVIAILLALFAVSYRRILVTEGIRRQRFELAI
jgi:hypothetical protein